MQRSILQETLKVGKVVTLQGVVHGISSQIFTYEALLRLSMSRICLYKLFILKYEQCIVYISFQRGRALFTLYNVAVN